MLLCWWHLRPNITRNVESVEVVTKSLTLCTVLEIAQNNLIHAFSCEIQVVRHFKAACPTMFRGLPWCKKRDKRTSLRLSSHSSSFLCSSRGLVERHTFSGCHEFFLSLSHCDGECTSGSLHSSCDTYNRPFPERFCPDVSDRTH